VIEPDLPSFVDAPGVFVAGDAAVVGAASGYFESVLTVDTSARSLTSVATEFALALGLERSLDRDCLVRGVRDALGSRRRLVVVHGPNPGLIEDPGLASIVLLPAATPEIVEPKRMTEMLHRCHSGLAEPPSAAALDRALAHAFDDDDWPATCKLAMAAHAYLIAEYRLAEAYEMLEGLRRAARRHGDVETANLAIAERSWIEGQWSRRAMSAGAGSPSQFSFGF
jgi:hypothetical protein